MFLVVDQCRNTLTIPILAAAWIKTTFCERLGKKTRRWSFFSKPNSNKANAMQSTSFLNEAYIHLLFSSRQSNNSWHQTFESFRWSTCKNVTFMIRMLRSKIIKILSDSTAHKTTRWSVVRIAQVEFRRWNIAIIPHLSIQSNYVPLCWVAIWMYDLSYLKISKQIIYILW